MAEKLGSREIVSVEEMLQTEIIVNQALIDLLVAKGIVTHEEILTRVKEIKQEQGIVLLK